MDVTRTQIYKDYSKQFNSAQLRKLRRLIRRQIKEDKAKVAEILKPFAGRKLDEETQREVFEALKAGFIENVMANAPVIVEHDLQDPNRLNVKMPSDMAKGLHLFDDRIDQDEELP